MYNLERATWTPVWRSPERRAGEQHGETKGAEEDQYCRRFRYGLPSFFPRVGIGDSDIQRVIRAPDYRIGGAWQLTGVRYDQQSLVVNVSRYIRVRVPSTRA